MGSPAPQEADAKPSISLVDLAPINELIRTWQARAWDLRDYTDDATVRERKQYMDRAHELLKVYLSIVAPDVPPRCPAYMIIARGGTAHALTGRGSTFYTQHQCCLSAGHEGPHSTDGPHATDGKQG